MHRAPRHIRERLREVATVTVAAAVGAIGVNANIASAQTETLPKKPVPKTKVVKPTTTPNILKSADRGRIILPVIKGIGATATENTALIKVSLAKPGNVELQLGTDPTADTIDIVTEIPKVSQVFDVPALQANTTYYYNLRAIDGKRNGPAKQGSFTTRPYPDRVTATVDNHNIIINGQPNFLYGVDFFCIRDELAADIGRLGINLVFGGMNSCDAGNLDGPATNRARSLLNENSLLYMDQAAHWDTVYGEKRQIGWDYDSDAFTSYFPEAFQKKPGNNRIVDMAFSIPWKAKYRLSPFPWKNWTTDDYKKYLAKTDIVTMYADPNQGECNPIAAPRNIKEAGEWIQKVAAENIPVVAGIALRAELESCNSPTNIDPEHSSAWRWATIINGARGFKYRTNKVGSSLIDGYEVASDVEKQAMVDKTMISAIQPAILTGQELPTTVTGDADVIATTFDFRGKLYEIITNTSEQPAVAKVTNSLKLAKKTAKRLWSNVTVKTDADGSINVELNPLETEVYRINKN